MAEEQQEQQVDENKRIRPRERARSQKYYFFSFKNNVYSNYKSVLLETVLIEDPLYIV